jgi:tRNA nucleotidyltransferase (CCA-adding enzyme)
MTDFPDKHVQVLRSLNQTPYDFRFVGGCVRDLYLGREPKDWDIVTDAPAWFLESLGMTPVGKAFPVYQHRAGDTVYEIACCRTEKKVGTGHAGFETEVCQDFVLDALRRDLTINTMWWCEKGPFRGFHSFDSNIVADHFKDHVLEAVTDAFADDPLRVLRVARFHAQLGPDWVLGPRVKRLMFQLHDEIQTLSADRVRCELEKALVSDHPSLFFQDLRQTGCLSFWFPELEAMIGCDHSGKPPKTDWHPEGDVWNHLMLVLDTARSYGANLQEMYGALGHDFGKPLVPVATWPHMYNHEQLGKEPIDAFCARLGLGHQTQHVMTTVAFQHTNVHNFMKLRPVTRVRVILAARRTVIGVEGLGKICMSDAQGRGVPFCDQDYPQMQALFDADTCMKGINFKDVPNMTRDKAESMYVKALKVKS